MSSPLPAEGQTWGRQRLGGGSFGYEQATVLGVRELADGVYDVLWDDGPDPVRYTSPGIAVVGGSMPWPPMYATLRSGAP